MVATTAEAAVTYYSGDNCFWVFPEGEEPIVSDAALPVSGAAGFHRVGFAGVIPRAVAVPTPVEVTSLPSRL